MAYATGNSVTQHGPRLARERVSASWQQASSWQRRSGLLEPPGLLPEPLELARLGHSPLLPEPLGPSWQAWSSEPLRRLR